MSHLPEDVVQLLAPFVAREDLERLRPVTGPPAAWLPAILGASATTFGQFVCFRPGAYNTDTARGLALIAHEGVHVTQFRELGLFRFLARYLRYRLTTRSRGLRHPMEAPCIGVQRRTLAALRSDGWP